MLLSTWLLYLVACIGLSLSPGPNGLLALTHGAIHGRRKALFTIAGGASGFLLVIALSLFGIGALLESSQHWLRGLKWAGGGYLIWLGVQVWRSPPVWVGAAASATTNTESTHATASRTPGNKGAVSVWLLYRQGALSALTNPKVLLFFSAFLSQFIDPQRSLAIQFVLLAGTFILIECVVEALLASLAHRVRPWLERVGRGFNRVCGGLFIAIGAALPLRG